MVIRKSGLLYKSFYILQKDLHQEFRTRYAINAIFLFAITTLVVVSFSIGAAELSQNILSSLLWIIIFFSAMTGLSHVFVREEEQQTADTLKLVAPPVAIYLGKLLFNILLLLGLELILIPLYVVFMDMSVGNLPVFILMIVLGSTGVSAVATIMAAIISRTSAKGALFAVLSFPVMLPVLILSIQGTALAIQGSSISAGTDEIQMLLLFIIVIVTASILLFEFVWIL
ncbi:MAG TPA: ABC transporter permease [Bacteroidetes bacterium]|nr:ABC transporter permease [Bacteroidota bacterium]